MKLCLINKKCLISFNSFYHIPKKFMRVDDQIKDAIDYNAPKRYNKNGTRVNDFYFKKASYSDHIKIQDHLNKTHKYHEHPFEHSPKLWRRFMEVVNPGEYERIKEKRQRRKTDMARAREFCRKIIYLHQKYLPKK